MLDGKDMPHLEHDVLVPASGVASRHALFLHGILGTGANWRGFARRFLDARPGWGAVLVDLRMHGRSQGFAPPHTLNACVEDLAELLPGLAGPVACVIGHSFGGKVALSLASAGIAPLEDCFVVDSNPGPRQGGRGPESTLAVLDLLARAPGEFPTRQAFIAHLEAGGLSRGVAQWLAMNLVRTGEKYTFLRDLDAIGALLEDYFAVDLWPVVEEPRGAGRFVVILGGRSTVLDGDARSRLTRAAERHPSRVCVHVIPDAGHWVHVDAPSALLELIVAGPEH